MIASQIQTGAFTLPAANSGNGTVVNVTITAVTLSRAMIQYSVRTANDVRMIKWSYRAEFTSTTNLRFTRMSDAFDAGLTLEWVVTEFASGVATIQAGSVNPSATPTDVTISAVNLTRAFPVTFSSTTDSAGLQTDDCLEATLSSTTNLRLQWSVAPATDACNTTWQVVEFATGITVQSGEKTYTHDLGSATQTITSVNLSKTVLCNTRQINYGGDALGRTSVRSVLTDATTITFSNTVTVGTAGNLVNAWFVLEFTDGTSVQSGLQTLAAATASADVTLSALTLTKSQPWISNTWQNFKTGELVNEGNCLCTFKLTTTTNLNITRTQTASGVDLAWFTVQWESPATNISKVNGVNYSAISKINNVNKASIAKLNGVT
jgi:hypothetical protein